MSPTRSISPSRGIEHLVLGERHIESVYHVTAVCATNIQFNLHFVIDFLVCTQRTIRVGNVAEDERTVVARGCWIPLRTSTAVIGIPNGNLSFIIAISSGRPCATAIETIRGYAVGIEPCPTLGGSGKPRTSLLYSTILLSLVFVTFGRRWK